MIVQDITALPTFNPHGGPITHSSTWSKPDSPVHPLFPNLFIARGLVCNSRATVPSDQFWYRTQYLFPLLWTPFHSVSGNERLPIRSKLLIALSYSALDVFHLFNSRDTHMFILGIPPRWFSLITSYRWRAAPYLFVSTMEFPEERTTTSSWCIGIKKLKTSMKGINFFEKIRYNFVTRTFPLYFPLKSRDEISCSGGELWRPGN